MGDAFGSSLRIKRGLTELYEGDEKVLSPVSDYSAYSFLRPEAPQERIVRRVYIQKPTQVYNASAPVTWYKLPYSDPIMAHIQNRFTELQIPGPDNFYLSNLAKIIKSFEYQSPTLQPLSTSDVTSLESFYVECWEAVMQLVRKSKFDPLMSRLVTLISIEAICANLPISCISLLMPRCKESKSFDETWDRITDACFNENVAPCPDNSLDVGTQVLVMQNSQENTSTCFFIDIWNEMFGPCKVKLNSKEILAALKPCVTSYCECPFWSIVCRLLQTMSRGIRMQLQLSGTWVTNNREPTYYQEPWLLFLTKIAMPILCHDGLQASVKLKCSMFTAYHETLELLITHFGEENRLLHTYKRWCPNDMNGPWKRPPTYLICIQTLCHLIMRQFYELMIKSVTDASGFLNQISVSGVNSTIFDAFLALCQTIVTDVTNYTSQPWWEYQAVLVKPQKEISDFMKCTCYDCQGNQLKSKIHRVKIPVHIPIPTNEIRKKPNTATVSQLVTNWIEQLYKLYPARQSLDSFYPCRRLRQTDALARNRPPNEAYDLIIAIPQRNSIHKSKTRNHAILSTFTSKKKRQV